MQSREIKAIEDLSLNAWPSHQMQLYDGWILRFSYFYTHRTNCVEQFGSSVLPLEEKIPYCEEIYRRWKSPCIFKITPLSAPELDGMLEQRGYEIQNRTHTMCMELDEVLGNKSLGAASDKDTTAESEAGISDTAICESHTNKTQTRICGPADDESHIEEKQAAKSHIEEKQADESHMGEKQAVMIGLKAAEISQAGSNRRRFTTIRIGDMTVRDRIPDEWIDALFTIKGDATVTHLKIVPSMYAAIPKEVRCVYIRDEEKIVATGLGILDRDYIGVYAINVDAGHRRRGLARKIVETLLEEGKKAGARRAYLQVVADNDPAIRLYEDLGFSPAYTYWFRVKSTLRDA